MYEKIYNRLSNLCIKLEQYQKELKKRVLLKLNTKLHFTDPKNIDDFFNGNIGTFTIHKIKIYYLNLDLYTLKEKLEFVEIAFKKSNFNYNMQKKLAVEQYLSFYNKLKNNIYQLKQNNNNNNNNNNIIDSDDPLNCSLSSVSSYGERE